MESTKVFQGVLIMLSTTKNLELHNFHLQLHNFTPHDHMKNIHESGNHFMDQKVYKEILLECFVVQVVSLMGLITENHYLGGLQSGSLYGVLRVYYFPKGPVTKAVPLISRKDDIIQHISLIDLHNQLWCECAGLTAEVPSVGDKVFYLPQRLLQQVQWDARHATFRLVALAVQHQPPSVSVGHKRSMPSDPNILDRPSSSHQGGTSSAHKVKLFGKYIRKGQRRIKLQKHGTALGTPCSSLEMTTINVDGWGIAYTEEPVESIVGTSPEKISASTFRTESDTSTHGGCSLPKIPVEKRYPALSTIK